MMEWKTVYASNTKVNEGMYVVTVETNCGERCAALAEYKDNKWQVFNCPYTNYKVVAVLKNLQLIKPYDGPIQKFKVGDIIVWGGGWMVIESFDYPSDIAARAKIGKYLNLVYEDFCPGNLSEAKLADEKQEEEIKKELVDYYKTSINVKGENISLKYLELSGMKTVNKELYQYIKGELENEGC